MGEMESPMIVARERKARYDWAMTNYDDDIYMSFHNGYVIEESIAGGHYSWKTIRVWDEDEQTRVANEALARELEQSWDDYVSGYTVDPPADYEPLMQRR